MNRLSRRPTSAARAAALALTGAVLLGAGGCRGDADRSVMNPSEPTAVDGRPTSRASGEAVQQAMQSGRLRSFPPVVQQRVLDDIGAGRIVNTRTQSSSAGVLYVVTYLQDGTPRQAIYDAEGRRVATPGGGGAASQPAVDAQPGPGLDLRNAETGQPLPGAATPATTGPIRQRNAGGY